MTRLAISIALLLSFQHFAGAADNKELWDEAAQKYDSGDYKGASETYFKLAERGFISAELYYNLGNAYFKSGSLGASIWAYRKALRIDPGMTKAKTNLQYVREFNVDKIIVKRGGFVEDIWRGVTGLLSANGFLIVFSVVWWFFGILLIYLILKPNTGFWTQYLLILVVIVAIFTGAASVTRVRNDRLIRWGVLSTPSVDIREGPGEDFEKIEVGHEGLEFRILAEREKSYLIELNNGLKGWVIADAVLEI